jgi:ubiquinone/menaquinone biosynthesis C-methylase UbiE
VRAELAAATHGGRVVEIGCGTGSIAEALLAAEPALAYAGVDLADGMVERARRRLADFGARAVVERGSATRLPFGERSLDGAFGVDVLHHVDDPVAVLAELRRVLRPGSPLVFLEANPRFPLTTLMGLALPSERGVLRIGPSSLARWARAAGCDGVVVRPGPVYTPPGPPRAIPLFDALDRAASRSRWLRQLALFYVLAARA